MVSPSKPGGAMPTYSRFSKPFRCVSPVPRHQPIDTDHPRHVAVRDLCLPTQKRDSVLQERKITRFATHPRQGQRGGAVWPPGSPTWMLVVTMAISPENPAQMGGPNMGLMT